jgi:hypothetical protein
VAFQVQPCLLACWAVGEWDVVVGYFVEEVDFVFVQEETGGNGVHRCVAPSFVEESAVLVEGVEVVKVGLGAEEIEVADLEVGPLNIG